MMRSHPMLRLALVLALLGGASGCATTRGQQADAEKQARRAESRFNIAADHMTNGRVELALRELLTAEQLAPDDPRIQHALGIAYLRKGKAVLGEQHMLRAIERSPGYHDARYNLSTLYLHQGRYEECIAQSEELVDDPTYAEPWRALTNWGWAAYRLGRVDEARQRLGRAREFSQVYWPTHLNLGILEAEQGNRSEAIRHFNAALALAPGPSASAEANYRLAEIYVSLGRRKEAVGHLRTAVVKAPNDPWGKKSEAYLKKIR